MKKQTSRWVLIIAGLLLLTLMLLGGGWWYYSLQNKTSEIPPTSPVFVFLLSPPGGDEINAGDFVPVTVQAVAPEPILSAELFVDGKSLGVATSSPMNASWTWQAWPMGLHSLFASATTAGGLLGQSQTVIVNVIAGDGAFQVSAGEGQTLDQIGAGFGLPLDQIAAANPLLDPIQPLVDGQPVQVPVDEANPGNTQPPDGGGANGLPDPFTVISWHLETTQPVDKSYCYNSTGDGVWKKMPQDPFDFFEGAQANYLQADYTFNEKGAVIQMQCWGWLGGVLKYLGQGETSFDAKQLPGEVIVNGSGFVLVGVPEYTFMDEPGGTTQKVPPPFALRVPASTSECASHGDPFLALFICDTLLNGAQTQYLVLEWEWIPKFCWGGNCPWFDQIDGYNLYQVDPLTKAETLLKMITNSSQKVTAIPVTWGSPCYGVRAFLYGVNVDNSEITIYCPGQVLTPKQVTVKPSDWLTTGGGWIEDGCENAGELDYYLDANQQSGYGSSPGEILTGSWIADRDDCYAEGNYSGGVKFGLQNVLSPDAVIQKAVLRFSTKWMDYSATGLAAPKPSTCVANIGSAKLDWTGLIPPNHFAGSTLSLSSLTYNTPFKSLSAYPPPEVDATSIVASWVKHPEKNHGFILTGASAPHPVGDGFGICLSGLHFFYLDIFYFAP